MFVLFFIFVACTYISLSSKIDIFLGNQEHPHDLLVDRSADCNDRRHPLHYCVQSPGQSTVYTVHECQSRSFVSHLILHIIDSWLLTNKIVFLGLQTCQGSSIFYSFYNNLVLRKIVINYCTAQKHLMNDED